MSYTITIDFLWILKAYLLGCLATLASCIILCKEDMKLKNLMNKEEDYLKDIIKIASFSWIGIGAVLYVVAPVEMRQYVIRMFKEGKFKRAYMVNTLLYLIGVQHVGFYEYLESNKGMEKYSLYSDEYSEMYKNLTHRKFMRMADIIKGYCYFDKDLESEEFFNNFKDDGDFYEDQIRDVIYNYRRILSDKFEEIYKGKLHLVIKRR